MRHVVNSAEVFHLWAHQVQSDARNAKDSVSFNGTVAKSYWYVIGKIMEDAQGEKVALIRDRYDSVTTMRHIGRARYAVNGVMRYFSVPFIPEYDRETAMCHQRNLAHFIAEYVEAITKAKRATQYGDSYMSRAIGSIDTADSYAESFKLSFERPNVESDCTALREHWAKRDARANDPKRIAANERAVERKREKVRDDYVNCLGDFSLTPSRYLSYRQRSRVSDMMTHADKIARKTTIARLCAESINSYCTGELLVLPEYARDALTDANKVTRDRSMRLKDSTIIARYTQGGGRYTELQGVIPTREESEMRHHAIQDKNREAINAWRRGEHVPNLYSLLIGTAVYMRIKGDEIETSQGARFPVAHARLAFPLVKRCRDNKSEFRRNGHTVRLGHYAIDHVTVDGDVKAGCHFVTWAEIEHCAKELGII